MVATLSSRPVAKLVPPETRQRRAVWSRVLGCAALFAGILWAYWPTLVEMHAKWASDPDYSHGYLVPLFAGGLLWWRRDQLASMTWQPSWWGAGLVAAGLLLRWAGAFFYFGWFDAVSLLPTLAGLCVAFGGWPALRWAWPGLAFLLFMIPLPHGLEGALALTLRRIATLASAYALQTLGYPAVAEGNVIVVDQLRVGVAEACSGLGMLVSFLALSTAVACTIDRPWLDRIIVLASAVPIALIANVVRITSTVFAYEAFGAETAHALFHDWAGWLMMLLALAMLGLELWLLSRLFVPVEPAPGKGPAASFPSA